MSTRNAGAQPPAGLQHVLTAWGIAGASLEPIGAGLINQTWRVRASSGERYALQRLNPIFAPEVNRDIAAVTRHLHGKGVVVPMLVPTANGALWHEDGGCWRLLEWIDGTTIDAVDTPARAAAAGALLGRFHTALLDLEHPFSGARRGVHDTRRHRDALAAASAQHPRHWARGSVQELAAALDALFEPLLEPEAPLRIGHGDPKINNVIFDGEGEARGLIDLDTVGPAALAFELGDALRSWCNPAGEDTEATQFSAEILAAAVAAYAGETAAWITPAEWQCIPRATLQIQLELAARFAADALNETYFAWDRSRFASSCEHNLVRARGQLNAARALLAVREDCEAAVAAAFSGASRR